MYLQIHMYMKAYMKDKTGYVNVVWFFVISVISFDFFVGKIQKMQINEALTLFVKNIQQSLLMFIDC